MGQCKDVELAMCFSSPRMCSHNKTRHQWKEVLRVLNLSLILFNCSLILRRQVINSWCSDMKQPFCSPLQNWSRTVLVEQLSASLHATLCGKLLHVNQCWQIMERHTKPLSVIPLRLFSRIMNTVFPVELLLATTKIISWPCNCHVQQQHFLTLFFPPAFSG